MSNYNLDLPADLISEAQASAAEKQVPLSRWITTAISAQIEAEKTRQLLQSYAEKADYAKVDAILSRVP